MIFLNFADESPKKLHQKSYSMKRTIMLFLIMMVASIADARVGTVLRGVRHVPRYKNYVTPIIIGGFASSAYSYSANRSQNNTTPYTTYYNTMATTPTALSDNSHATNTSEDSLHATSLIASNNHDSSFGKGTAGTSESGKSVWLYVLFGMMALAAITLIYMLIDDDEKDTPVVNHQDFVVTEPSPRIIELANGGGVMIV